MENSNTPRVIKETFAVNTNDPDKRDYRSAELMACLLSGMGAMLVSFFAGSGVLGCFGLLDAKHNPINGFAWAMQVVVVLISGVNSLWVTLLVARIQYGVLIDRRKRILKIWSGPIQRLYPRTYSIDVFQALCVSATTKKLSDNRSQQIFAIDLCGQMKLKLFDSEGEAHIRKLAKELGDFLLFPIRNELDPEPDTVPRGQSIPIMVSLRQRVCESNDIPESSPIPARWINQCQLKDGRIMLNVGRAGVSRCLRRLFAEPMMYAALFLLAVLSIAITAFDGVVQASKMLAVVTGCSCAILLFIFTCAHITFGAPFIEADPKEVRVRKRFYFVPKTKVYPIDDVFDIRIADGTVLVITPDEHIPLGDLLTPEESNWLRSVLIRAIVGA